MKVIMSTAKVVKDQSLVRRKRKGNDYISREFKQRLMLISGGCCQNCGSSYNLTVDHLVPLSVFRYTCGTDKLDIRNNNTTVLCENCNYNKNVDILPKEKLVAIAINKEAFSKWYDTIEVYIEEYKKLVEDVLNRQNNRCICCGLDINKGDKFNFRRLDSTKGISNDNIGIIHLGCNVEFRRKKQMQQDMSKYIN